MTKRTPKNTPSVTENQIHHHDPGQLRSRAEETFKSRGLDKTSKLSQEELQHLLHELQVHQIELEMQNEELRQAQVELDSARARYFDLYDLAPVGYLSLSDKGLILDGNLTASNMLGLNRNDLLNQPITRFIGREGQEIYYLHRKKLFETSELQECDLQMKKNDGTIFWARIEIALGKDEDSTLACRVVMIDITASKQAELELTKSEERFHQMFNSHQAIMLVIEPKSGAIIEANAAAAQFYGYSNDQLCSLNIHDINILPPDEVASERQKAVKEQRNYFVFQHCLANGELRWVEVYSSPIEVNGQSMLFSIIHDITDRKKAESELQASTEKYRSLFETSKDSIFIVDQKTGDFISANSAACQLYGYTLDEFMQMKHIDVSAKPEKTKAAIHDSVSRVDMRLHRKKDGTVFPVEIVGAYFMQEGRLFHTAFIRDITQRKQSEETLEQTRQNYETFFNTIDEFLLVVDEHGNIIHTNKTVITRLGYSIEELIGKPVIMMHPPECIDEAGIIIEEIINKRSDGCTLPIITKSGVRIPVETRVSHGFWDGKPVIFGVSKDISKIKESEEKFSKIFHLNPSACGLSDLADQRYIDLNRAFYTLFGFDKDEAIGKTAEELGIIDSKTRNAVLLKADSKGTIINAYADLKKKNGDILHVLLSAENIHVQDKTYRFTVVNDITYSKRSEAELEKYRRHLEHMIKERTSELEGKSMTLMETNTALKVLLKQREDDKKDMEERFLMNLQTLVLPHVEQIKKGHLESRQQSYLGIVETHLKEIASPLLRNIQQFNLTPRETKVASLIRQEKSTKEIAEILGLASGSIDVYRRNLRKKLGLNNRKVNLLSFLKNLG
jgi:PAS domain S-box-containing protein